MNKREAFRAKLEALVSEPPRMATFLMDHAGLPGRRVNLELSAAFADLAAAEALDSGWIERLHRWGRLSVVEAPSNHPREFLPFVAIQALGASFCSAHDDARGAIESALRSAANDSRWRMREACAFGLQRVGVAQPEALRSIVARWMSAPSLLELRAVLVGLADPPLLASGTLTSFALETADAILNSTLALSHEELRSEPGKSIQKALAFAPSVFVAAAPAEGFCLLEGWADRGSLIAAKVVAANLRKARLARYFPDEVQDVGLRLQAAVFD